MNKLTIGEIIEHCKRKIARYEQLNGIKTLENADISNSFIKEYWEHRQVAEYLEEIQQYRAIGTVEECRLYKGISEKDFSTSCLDLKIIDELREYKNIGTIEECREAMESQRTKNPKFEVNIGDYTSRFVCECGKKFIVKHDCGVMDNHDAPNYCSNCGCKFDWSNTD